MRLSSFLIISCCLLSSFCFAQTKKITVRKQPITKVVDEYAAIDKKALQIPDAATTSTDGIAAYINANFTCNKEKARAAFIWIATNIQYDVQNMFAINFYEKREDKIAKPLQTRKGICENYAALFNDICSKTGIPSYVVEGYTKQKGFADYIPHAWCAAQIDTTWFIIDPTWGSGYISNGKFVNKINNDYFMAPPAIAINSHMPFDYLWQFLNYPVTNEEFYDGNTKQNTTKPFFNFTDSIAAIKKLDKTEFYIASADRMQRNGVKNSLIYDRLQHIRREVEIDNQNKIVNLYNGAIADYNASTNSFNTFINFRNKQFKPEQTDAEIQTMLNTAANELKSATEKLDKLKQVKTPDGSVTSMITTFGKQVTELSTRIEEQQDWLTKYFSKGKAGRRGMFTKYTWFGIPLN